MNDKTKKSWDIIVDSCKDTRHGVSVSTQNRRAAIIAADNELEAYRELAKAAGAFEVQVAAWEWAKDDEPIMVTRGKIVTAGNLRALAAALDKLTQD